MSQSFIDYLKTVDTPTLINGIETLKLRPIHEGFTPLEIRCLFPELGRMCGYAVTAQEIGGFGAYAAHCGEVMATFFTRLGATGLVSDCAVRDLPEVRRLGFHYFARGSVASHANYGIVRTNTPVQILGMPVKPGDLLHGDENGLITIPAGVENTPPEAIENVRRKERKVMDFVRSPEFSLDRFLGVVE
jgi:4-hydroxy-4-methyl-2-oxoglutarate aldolase